MNRQTSAPREDTLRLTRTLRPGLVFHAPATLCARTGCRCIARPSPGRCRSTTYGNSSYARLGEVRCRLLAVEEHGKPVDLTAQAVAEDHPRPITVAGNSETPNTQMDTQDSGGSPYLATRQCICSAIV